MSVDVETVELKPHIAAIIAEVGLDNLSAKTVRESVESKLGLEAGALKPRKKDIADLIDAVINEQDAGDDGDDGDDDDSDSDSDSDGDGDGDDDYVVAYAYAVDATA